MDESFNVERNNSVTSFAEMATNEKSRVEIGYLEETEEKWRLESRFFPSKVGGKPAWLDLKNISIDLSCENCKKPLVFLCQLYAPLDNQNNAFHRTLFVFACRDAECYKSNLNHNFKVFRCQLPQENDYYSPDEPEDRPDWHPESSIHKFSSTCIVCGCLGPHQCGKCKKIRYCSKEHQVLDWKSGHNTTCGSDEDQHINHKILFPEFEIITEPEIMDWDDEEKPGRKPEKSDEEKLREFEQLLKEGKGGILQDISPEILEKYALNKEDKYFKYFKSRLNICPDQVVRFDRGGQPLWITQPNLKEEDIPNCELCNGPRQFEFQVLSTILTHLNVDKLGQSIDWGTLLIYTCKNNCEEGPAYKKEFLWKQDV